MGIRRTQGLCSHIDYTPLRECREGKGSGGGDYIATLICPQGVNPEKVRHPEKARNPKKARVM